MPRTRRNFDGLAALVLVAPFLAALILAGAVIAAPTSAQAVVSPATARLAAAPPAVSSVAALDARGLPTRVTGVDDFTFDSFDAVYRLGRNGAMESTLATTETLVAEFPNYDQNRGIIRAIPAEYDGHPTQIHVVSVTDGTGAKRSFETTVDSGFFKVTIAVPKGQYVHGKQTYVISYTQQDVTRYYSDNGDDQFYWDVNGTGWAQPFAEVSAKVSMSAALEKVLDGKTACFYGPVGSSKQCDITGADSTYTASQTGLQPYQNVTVVLGFAKGTFAAASNNPLHYIGATAITGAVGALLLFLFGLFVPLSWRQKGTGIVVAQYAPPPGVNVMVAANIVDATKKGFAAAIVDLAVRGKLKIHVRKSGLFGTSEQFGVQPLDSSGLDSDEAAIYSHLTADSEENGVVWLQKKDTTLGTFVRSLTLSVAAATVRRALRTKPPRWAFWIALLLAAVSIGLMLLSVTSANSDTASFLGVVGAGAGLAIAVFTMRRVGSTRPLSKDGALLKEYLEGLKLYIRFGEADRLQMLQSVTGAERIDTTDAGQIVKIYEKLLPYATLFGLERAWASELGKFYDQNPPSWYDGGNLGAFSAGYFVGSIGSFASSTASSYSGSAASSGSGGFGGGFSGGGGGGGGGGGI